jgi:hypothetical protein
MIIFIFTEAKQTGKRGLKQFGITKNGTYFDIIIYNKYKSYEKDTLSRNSASGIPFLLY